MQDANFWECAANCQSKLLKLMINNIIYLKHQYDVNGFLLSVS